MFTITTKRKASLLIFMCVASAKLAFGQGLKPDAILKADNFSYKTKTMGAGKFASISVTNTKNVLFGKKNRTGQSTLSYIGKTNNSSLLAIFNRVFSDERIRQLLPEGRITINCYVNPDGKILEISYLLDRNTSLKPVELEKLETALKNNYTFKLLPSETKGGDFFVITLIVKYSWLLDGTLK